MNNSEHDALFDGFADDVPTEYEGSPAPPPSEPPRGLVAHNLKELEEYLEQFAGKEHIGLPQKTLPTLDKNTLGLRGLTLLAAPPNFGKTALAVQIALDVIKHNPDACALIVSLEMSRFALMTRILSRMSGLNWQTFVQGHPSPGLPEHTWSAEEQAKKHEAYANFRALGERLCILDRDNMTPTVYPLQPRTNPQPDFTAEAVLRELARLKQSSGCQRAFVLVDYLQVWPMPANSKTKTDIEADQWRVEQMLQLRSSIDPQALGAGALFVISETNKQSWKGDSDEGLSAIMGSARATYAPDCVMLLRPFSDKEIEQGREGEGDAKAIRDKLSQEGKGLAKLAIIKGRDGFTRNTIDLVFYFKLSHFKEAKSEAANRAPAPDKTSPSAQLRTDTPKQSKYIPDFG